LPPRAPAGRIAARQGRVRVLPGAAQPVPHHAQVAAVPDDGRRSADDAARPADTLPDPTPRRAAALDVGDHGIRSTVSLRGRAGAWTVSEVASRARIPGGR